MVFFSADLTQFRPITWDWAIPPGMKPSFATSDTIPAAPQLCRVAAMWNAQGQTPFMCPVPLDGSGACPCPAGTAKCPAYPLNIPKDLTP